MKTIRNILVIRMNRTGDMICTIPLMKTLKKEIPHARLTVFAEESNAEIIANEKYIDRIVVFKKGAGIYSNKILNILKTLQGMSFDLAIGVKGGFSSFLATAALLSRAQLRVGYTSTKKHIANLFYNMPVEPMDFYNTHQVHACLNLLKAIGVENWVEDVSINVLSDSKEFARSFLTSNKLKPEDRLIIFNISNNRKTSLWEFHNFMELGRIFSDKYHYKCIITGISSDEDKARDICRGIGSNAFFCKTAKLMDFAAITSMCNMLVAGDGGASHIGAAVGTRVVALFGETSPIVWKPYGEQHIVLSAANGDVNSFSVKDVLNAIESKGLS